MFQKIEKFDLALAAAVSFGAARFWVLRGHVAFVDEQTGILTGWLLSRGLRLYADVFNHHNPYEYLFAAVAAWLGGPTVGAGRAAAILLWVAACAAVHVLLRRGGKGPVWVGPCFALLSACWAPLWWGHLLLIELHWSLALTLLAALWGRWAAGERRPLEPRTAAAAGFLAALIAGASLSAVLPAALAAGALAAAGVLRGKWRLFLAGGAVYFALLLGSGWRSVAWESFYEYGVRFNFVYYARFAGFESAADLYWRQVFEAFRHWSGLGARSWTGIEPLITAGALGICAALWRARGPRWALGALAVLVAARVPVEAPGLEGAPLFHASAYYCLCVLAIAWGLDRLAQWRRAAAAAALAALIAASWPAWRQRPQMPLAREKAEVARLVREITEPGDRVVALPSYPRFYMSSRRLPGIVHILYLPWVAAAQEKRALKSLKERRPAVVFLENGKVGPAAFSDYGRALVQWIHQEYAPFRLELPYGGRIHSRADAPVWEEGIYILKEREAEIIKRAREKGLAR